MRSLLTSILEGMFVFGNIEKMTHLNSLGFQVELVMFVGRYFKRDGFDDAHAIPFQSGLFHRVVGNQTHISDTQGMQHPGSNSVIPFIILKAQFNIGFHGIPPLLLKFISFHFVVESDPPSLLTHVEKDATPLVPDRLERLLHLGPAIAPQRTEDVAGQTLRVDPGQHRAAIRHVSEGEGDVMLFGDLVPEELQPELTERRRQSGGENVPDQEPSAMAGGGLSSWAVLLAGLGAVVLSSEVTVNSVVNIAYALDISEALISVLIIGLGTSLPELSISIAAILKKRKALSVGNIIGSNILDTLLPVGIAALISGVTFERQLLFFDLPFIFVLTVVVLALLFNRKGIRRPQGLVILGLYAAYVLVKLSQF